MKAKILGELLALHLKVPGRKSPAKPLQYLIALKEDLANCRRPVKRSMNSIKARFAHRAPGPGEGSTFIVELPGEAADDAVTTKRCNFAVVVG
jgi:hypothetical protein